MPKEPLKYKIEKTKNGVTVWIKDGKIWRWVVDASTIKKENMFWVAKEFAKKIRTPKWETIHEYEVKL